MKRLFTILFLLISVNSYGAELLVKAKPHWMDSIKQSEVNKMSAKERAEYDFRGQIGDIIVIRPNGWQWGSSERLPSFYVIKVPNLPYENAKHLEDKLLHPPDANGERKPKRKRKFKVPTSILNQADENGFITININADIINNIIEKTQ